MDFLLWQKLLLRHGLTSFLASVPVLVPADPGESVTHVLLPPIPEIKFP
jgi:hypothetical protein